MKPEARSPVAAGTAIGADRSVSIGSDGNQIPQQPAPVSGSARSRPSKFSGKQAWLLGRVKEVFRLLSARASIGQASDTDAAALIVADALQQIRQGGVHPTDRWFSDFDRDTALRAIRSVEAVVSRKGERYRPITNVAAGKLLALTSVERDELGLRQLCPVDETKAVRKRKAKAKKRLQDRNRQRENRAGKHTPRHMSLAATKPWLHFGYSQATWYRRGKPAPEEHDKDLSPPIVLPEGKQRDGVSTNPCHTGEIANNSRPSGDRSC